ncbi:MAG: aa3-type cytochrome c oxidase subunit IV [Sphingomonas sp.]
MAGSGDIQAHEQTYHTIVGLIRWGAVVVFLLAFLVIFLIV